MRCVLTRLTIETQVSEFGLLALCAVYSFALSASREEKADIFITIQAFLGLNGYYFHLFFGEWQKDKECISVSLY